VIDLLAAIEEGGASGTAPGSYFSKRRYAGSKDRRAIIEQLFCILRSRAKLDWWIASQAAAVDITPRSHVIADLVLRGGLSESDIAGLFGSTDYAPPSLTPDECALIRDLEGQDHNHLEQAIQPLWIRKEFPDWLEASLAETYGEKLEQEMIALNEPAPVDLRINTFITSLGDVQQQLAKADIACDPTSLSPMGLRLHGHPRVTHTQAFKDGLFEVQDEGSQLAALLTDARAGMTVIDYCAGAGGKTLALVNAMIEDDQFDGLFWACDITESRLRELNKRATRNGTAEAILPHDLSNDDTWLHDNAKIADRVLADVPCSGSGAWRRAPESRWRLTAETLQEYIDQQRDILAKAGSLVKSGGRLIYVTCSILPAENEDQIAWFLENHPDFSALPVTDLWARIIGGTPPTSSPTSTVTSALALRLSPASSQTDGFFIAILQKS
jgi:16S rRNA (cytosine967-C5)-methyltransferase